MKLEQTEQNVWRFTVCGYNIRIEQESRNFDVYVDGFSESYVQTVCSLEEAVGFAIEHLLKDVQSEIDALNALKLELLSAKMGF